MLAKLHALPVGRRTQSTGREGRAHPDTGDRAVAAGKGSDL